MKAFTLSTTSRPYRILKAMDIHLHGDTTFCDVVAEIIKVVIGFVFAMATSVLVLWPIVDMGAWVVAMIVAGGWIAPQKWCAIACCVYLTAAIIVSIAVQYMNWRDNHIEHQRKLKNVLVKQNDGTWVPLVPASTRVKGFFCRKFEFDKSKYSHQFIASLYVHTDMNNLTWCSVITCVIGFIILTLVGVLLCIGALYPIGVLLGAIAFLILHPGETLHLSSGILMAWIIEFGIILWITVPLCFKKLLKTVSKEGTFTKNLWDSFKNKTCMKIEIVD